MTANQEKTLLLLKPRGFCAGVVRAIDIVRIALDAFGPPIYVRKEIVHNRYVVEELQAKGAIFVDEVYEVPDGQRLIYSAHGVAPSVREASKLRDLKVIDATCPLVTKVHVEAVRYAKGGYSIILIGHHDHDEVIGTLGEAPEAIVVCESVAEVEKLELPDPERVAYITQTTLSLDDCAAIVAALKRRFPSVKEPAKDDICYATQNRQNAVKRMAPVCRTVLVVGAPTSSNANRLVEVAAALGSHAYLIEGPEEIQPEWLTGDVGLTAGASTPESVVQACVDRVCALGPYAVEPFMLVEERIMFPLPSELLAVAQEKGVAVGAGNERAAERAAAEFRIRHH